SIWALRSRMRGPSAKARVGGGLGGGAGLDSGCGSDFDGGACVCERACQALRYCLPACSFAGWSVFSPDSAAAGIGGGALAGCSPGDSVALAVWGFSLSLIANSFQGRRQSVFRRGSAAKKIYFFWSTKS